MGAVLADPSRSEEITNFVRMKTGVWSPLGSTQVMGFVDEHTDELAGAWMFERYTGVTGSVHIHWAAHAKGAWLTRGMLSLVSIYAYDQLGVDVMFAEVRGSDKAVRSLDERLGFVKTAVIPAYFPDDDLIVYSMTKHQCRWLPAEYKETVHG